MSIGTTQTEHHRGVISTTQSDSTTQHSSIAMPGIMDAGMEIGSSFDDNYWFRRSLSCFEIPSEEHGQVLVQLPHGAEVPKISMAFNGGMPLIM